MALPLRTPRAHPAPRALLLSACLSALLAACGGGGGGGGSGNTASTATSLSGSVVDGPLRGATVKAFQLTDNVPAAAAIATATTAADGSYTLTLPSASSATFIVTASGGQYCAGSTTAQVSDAGTCAEGTLTTLGVPLVTVASASAGATTTAHVTPVSTAAAQLSPITVASDGTVSGSIALTEFANNFSSVSNGKSPNATPTELTSLLQTINAMQQGNNAIGLAEVINHIQAGALKSQTASTAQPSFSIQQGGPVQNLNGNEGDSITVGKDPTLLYDTTDNNSLPTKTSYGTSVSSPFFSPRSNIDVATLKAIMEDDTVIDVEPHAPVIVTVGGERYKGYRLADVIVRATKFRPRDSNIGAFGVTTAVVAFSAEGRTAAFSFTELIRTANGDKTIVAYEKNDAPLPASEGALAIIAGNDYDPWLRKVPRLKDLHIRNDYLPGSASLNAGTPESVQFDITGKVQKSIKITAATLSSTSSQGYYAVDKIGDHPVGHFATYHFQEYGPRHMNYWWGQGVRLTDVLDSAGLTYPNDKGACFVVVRSKNGQPALFSCGELYNSSVGTGDGEAGEAKRSRRKGVLLVTDDFRLGGGNKVMMSCWDNIDTCTKDNAGDPTAYTSNMDSNTDLMNNQFIALVSTEDVVPFQPTLRWFPSSLNNAGLRSCSASCIPWIDIGERLQQGITSIEVFYAGGTGNNTKQAGSSGSGSSGGSSGGGSGGSSNCTEHQIHTGTCPS